MILQVLTLHDAATLAWAQDDVPGARRFALAAVQAVLAGRGWVRVGGEGLTPLPVRRAAAGVAVVAAPGGWALTLLEGGRPLPAARVRGVGGPEICDGTWLALHQGAVVVLSVAPAIVAALGRSRPDRDGEVPGWDAPRLLAEIASLRAHGIEPRVDPSLDIAALASAGRTEMRLANIDGMLYASLRVAPFGDDATWVPGVGEAQVLALRRGELVRCDRDLDAEGTHAIALCQGLALTVDPAQPFLWRFETTAAALDFLSRLQAQSAQLVVRWDSAPLTLTQAPPDLSLRVPSGVDWLSGSLQLDGAQVELQALLQAMRDGRRFVEVRGGVWVEIRARLRRQLAQVAAHVDAMASEGDEPSATLARWNRLRRMVEEGIRVERDPDRDANPDPDGDPSIEGTAVADLRASRDEAVGYLEQRHRAAMAMDVQPPAGLRAMLRPYQAQGFAFLVRTAAWAPGALLADDMGLGKTVQALALLLERARLGGALVVAPAAVLCVWQREAARFAPSLRVELTTADLLRRTPTPTAGELWLCSWAGLTRHAMALAGRRFATIVYDEAQMAKNPDTARAAAARGMQAEFSVLLSGTPVENRTLELWSLFAIAVPGLLGDRRPFFSEYALKIEHRGDGDAARELAALVAPFWLRRTKAEVASELPERIEVDVPVLLSPAERKQYEIVRGAAVEAVRQRRPEERTLLFAAMTRLRQLACHPRLVDPASTMPSAKLERALELLRELRDRGHRCLVFSQFTAHLDLVAEAMAAEGFVVLRLDGRTSKGQRNANVARFQAGNADALLISLGAGGTGLTLTAADTVVLLDPWWNPAAEAQAADRAHRIGQRRVVTIYRLLSEDTLETRVRQLQKRKGQIAGTILDGIERMGGQDGPLDLRTLHALLGDDDDLQAQADEARLAS